MNPPQDARRGDSGFGRTLLPLRQVRIVIISTARSPAVGQRIWLAINGKVTVALRDKFGELEGRIAVQIHGGPPQTVAYKDLKLVHNPKVELVGMDEDALNALLIEAPETGAAP